MNLQELMQTEWWQRSPEEQEALDRQMKELNQEVIERFISPLAKVSGGIKVVRGAKGAKAGTKKLLGEPGERKPKDKREINPYLKGVKKGDEMIATHNLSEANLLEAHELGGLPVPSIGISKVKYPMDQFGDIALIPDQHMVTPSGRSNPVYSTDAYSKRFPEVDYTVDPPRIFKGFTHGGKRRYSDYTLDNLVKMMKGDPRNAEDYFYGAGSLRAEHTPPFKNFKAMQKSRDKLISNKEMAQVKRRMSDEFEEIVDALGPYDKNPSLYDNMGYMDVVGARLGRKERLSDYYDDLPRDVLDKISKFKRNLIDAPTEYFEAKPQRAVRLDEFKGAVVPEGATDRTMEILKRFHKIGRIEKYGGNKQTKEQALKSFGDLMFSPGAGLLPVNKILNAFKPREPWQQVPVGSGYHTMRYGPRS